MKIGIDKGHCIVGVNTGAQGCGKKEELLTREVGSIVYELIKSKGYDAIDCTVDKARTNTESLNLRVRNANNSRCNLFLSIHFNSYNGDGHGTEVYIYDTKDVTSNIGKRICSNFEKLGYKNRGVKVNKDLYVIKNTSMPAMLIECCFIDNKNDMDKYNPVLFAEAIVNGLLDEI